MDRNGAWKVKMFQTMEHKHAELKWQLYDPNGFQAGAHTIVGDNLSQITAYIESQSRPYEHSMPYGVNVTVSDPTDIDKTRVNFEIAKKVSGCDYMSGVECKPYMTTETNIEDKPFAVQVCEQDCKDNRKTSPLVTSDLWCQDLNDAEWYKYSAGWKRDFECGFKGFD
jgi:hypothetical protein